MFCKHCKYWERLPRECNDDGLGLCKRHAPAGFGAGMYHDGEEIITTKWPTTRENEGCGDWEFSGEEK